MQIALFRYHNRNPKKNQETLYVKNKLMNVIQNTNKLTLNQEHPQIVISIGGDGTFLGAFHHYSNIIDSVHFVGIDTGHLGFYTDWTAQQLPQFIDSLLNQDDDGKNVSYALLHIRLNTIQHNFSSNNHPNYIDLLALNECTIKRADGSTLKANVYNNDSKHPFEKFRGDGLCVCTPTGSTAYNKSLRGPVLCPDLNVIALSHIAPINSTTYPSLENSMVINANDKFTIYPQCDDHNLITVDGDHYDKTLVKSMVFNVSKHHIHFVKHHHIPFWDRVSRTFVSTNLYGNDRQNN